MGKRILTLSLWALVAFLIIKTCMPSDDEGNTGRRGEVRVEDFGAGTVPPPDSYPLVLENRHLYSEWSVDGASCGRILLKDYHPELGSEEGQKGWLLLYDAKWVESKAPGEGRTASDVNYRRRDAFRLLDDSRFLFPTEDPDAPRPNLDRVRWKVEELAEGPRGAGLRFTWESESGVELIKELRLPDDAFHFDVRIAAAALKTSAAGRDLPLKLATGGGIRAEDDPYYANPYVGAARRDHKEFDNVEFVVPDGDFVPGRAAETWTSAVPFVVEGSKYFLSAIQPLGRDFDGATSELLFDDRAAGLAAGRTSGERLTVNPLVDPFWKRASIAGGFALHLGQPGVEEGRDFRWYVGPKDPRVLTKEAYGELAEVIDAADYGRSFFYRMFLTGWIAPVILFILRMFEALVHNWGIAIILMTVLVRAAIFPLMRHSQVKMAEYQAKMTKVKPQLDAINKKYAKDPQRKQQETMKLYQQHKLSPPIGGCLPILLQMPIFVGLFQALRSSILLRHEPFFLWIEDLSQPDALIEFGGALLPFWPFSGVTTLNLLPILMTVLWIIHQRSMPKPTDPQQAQMHKMMAFMPILFGFILYNYAAGLSLYMITSSSIGIFEQRVIKKRWPVSQPGQASGDAKA